MVSIGNYLADAKARRLRQADVDVRAPSKKASCFCIGAIFFNHPFRPSLFPFCFSIRANYCFCRSKP